MIFFCLFRSQTSTPKYLDRVIASMKSADRMLAEDDAMVEQLTEALVDRLNEDKPKGSPAYVELSLQTGGKGGSILLYKNDMGEPVARLYFYKARSVGKDREFIIKNIIK